MEETYVSDLFLRVARERNITIVIEPESGRVGEMVFPDGRRHLFKNCNPNINSSVSVELARDKAYSHYFLRARKIATPRSVRFFSDAPESLEQAIGFAETVGYPVFVKPNNLGEGQMVYKACDAAEARKWGRRILGENIVGIVEELCPGNDYRVVVLDGKVISAYQRLPLAVIGNGRDDIAALLAAERDAFPALGRPLSEIDPDDARIDTCLAREGLDRTHVPAAGKRVRLLDNANLSTGGTSIDLTGAVHASFAAIAAGAGAALGLRLAGIDILADDLTVSSACQRWSVIEVNGEPDLDNYAATGREQEERLRGIYGEILKRLEAGERTA